MNVVSYSIVVVGVRCAVTALMSLRILERDAADGN